LNKSYSQNEREVEKEEIPQAQAQTQKDESPLQCAIISLLLSQQLIITNYRINDTSVYWQM
jgi:hypothetical protein